MSISQKPDTPSGRPRLMVTGASGNLGHWICRLALDRWTVYGVHWRHPISVDGADSVQIDLTRTKELEKGFMALKPHAVVHAAAIAQPGVCESDPGGTRPLNVDVPRFLSGLCANSGIPFVFTSTDLVFDGRHGPYDENSPVSPINVYGRQKVDAETAILNRYPGALVCRMPLMFGPGPRQRRNFSLEMLSAIRNRRPVRLFIDEFRTPVDFQTAAQGLLCLLGRSQGMLHLGGRSRVSRFELGALMVRHMAASPEILKAVSIHEVSLGTNRSPDCSLNSDSAYALGYDPLPLSDAVKRVVEQFNVISKG